MNPKLLLSRVSCAVLVAGCAAPAPAPPPAPPARAALPHQADSAIKAGQVEAALAGLKVATTLYPADKIAWLRIAQMSFDRHDYGQTITHATKVLELDRDDIVAHSLLAVSGLRVSSKALSDLTAKKKVMSGDVRLEAQNLAAILRSSIGGEIIPTRHGHRLHSAKTPAPVAAPVVKTAAQELVDLLNQPNDPGKK